MSRLLELHLAFSRLVVRLFLLQLLWLGWTLRGAVVLGAFPATAAVHAVLRQDERDRGADLDAPGWRTTRAAFGEHVRRERRSANRLGGCLVVAWLIVLASRAVVERVDLGGTGPALAGAHTVLGVLLALVTVLVWPLHAHFQERTGDLVRRAVVLVLGRPAVTAVAGLGVGLVVSACYLLPGLVPVVGVVGSAAVTTAVLWRMRVLAMATTPREPERGELVH